MDESLGVIVIKSIFDQLSTYQAAISGDLISSARGFSRMFVVLYIVIVGYRILMGKVGEKAANWGVSIALVIVLQGMVLESSGYSNWVMQPLMGTALDMAAFFSGSEAGNEFGLFYKLDEAASQIITAVDRLDPGGNIITNSMAHLKVAAASLILLIFVCGLYMTYLALSLLALFSMYVLLLVGPPFLFFAAFEETRFIAKTWLKTFLQYAVWLSLLSLVMALGVSGVIKAAGDLSNWDVVRDGVFTKQYALTLLFCGTCIYFLLKVSDLSAALTGGMGMQSGLAAGMIGGGLSAMGSLAGAAAGGAANLAAPAASAMKYGAGRAAGAAASAGVRAFSAMRGINQ